MKRKLIGYLRTSTDDKGQDPDRQKPAILARAARDGDEVVAWVVDEGTSGGVPVMDRPKIKEAITLAKQHGASAIIVEAVDRFSRSGPQDVGVAMWLLQQDYDLGVVFAELSGDDFVVELLTGILATIAKMVRKRLSEMTRSGMQNAKRKGIVLGRPRKADLSNEEMAAVAVLVRGGAGMRLAALEISRRRGAFEVADPKARRDRTVSASWLTDQLANRPETPGLLGRVVVSTHKRPRPNGPIPVKAQDGVPA